MNSREKILNRITKAEIDKKKNPNAFSFFTETNLESVFFPLSDNLQQHFSDELNKASGNFHSCPSVKQLPDILKNLSEKKQWKNIFTLEPEIQQVLQTANIQLLKEESFLKTEVGITKAEFLIARYGSIMVSSAQYSGRKLNIYPPILVVVANLSCLLPDIKDAINAIKKKYSERMPSQIAYITGPSRTADIEKTLVLGAHGPKELHVILVNDNNFD